MNDFVAKPIDINKLAKALLHCVPEDFKAVPNAQIKPQTAAVEAPAEPFELPGLDLVNAVKRMGGNWALLKRTLLLFANDFGNIATELDAQVKNEQWEDAERIVHSIKGLSLSIGAEQLHQRSVELEPHLKAHSTSNLDLFMASLSHTLASIATLDPEPLSAAQETPPIDIEQLRPHIEALTMLLETSGFIPPDLIDNLKTQLKGVGASEIQQTLFKQIDCFDYAQAKLTLRTLMLNLGLRDKSEDTHDE